MQDDGSYVGYESFTKARMGSIIRYQCWAHARRKFIEAEKFAPDKVKQVITWIQILYAVEEKARGCAHSDDLDHLFQTIPITCSDGSRSSVPDDADQSGGGRWRPEDTSFLGG